MKIAILDLGTNTFHLLIAEVKSNGTWVKIFKERITVKLGQGGIDRNIISPSPYQRGIKAIQKFHEEIKCRGVKKLLLLALLLCEMQKMEQNFEEK
ncbi:MAG: hypothetical protein IPP71_23250 [Bacteroidetes bacterium]|nr:hypothetical protein [Bacteroidota bacterium]